MNYRGKETFLNPLPMCVYHGVRNASFSENVAYIRNGLSLATLNAEKAAQRKCRAY